MTEPSPHVRMMNYGEAQIQRDVVKWFRLQYPKLAEMLISYPAGINMTMMEAVRHKAMGLRAGVPDLVLLIPKFMEEDFSGALFVELKTEKGKLSKEQERYHGRLRYHGYTVITCFSFEEAVEGIKKYLGSHPWRYD